LLLNANKHTLCQQVITHKYGYLGILQYVYGRQASPLGGIVNNIVMDQCGRMEQFNESGSNESGFIDRAIESGGEKDEQWPHLLALAADKVAQYDMKEGYVTLQGTPEVRFKITHLCRNLSLYV